MTVRCTRLFTIVQLNGGTAPGAEGGRGSGDVPVTVDCLPVESRRWRPQPGNNTLCSEGRRRKRLPLGAAADQPSLPPVAPVAMSVIDDSPEMTSLLLDDVMYDVTPTLLLLQEVIVP